MISAPAAEVFEVLGEAATYAHWVVGSRRVRAADPDWPRSGSGFDHTVGLPPLTIDDETVVLECDPPRHLRLHVKARPLPSGVVDIELRPEGAAGERTRVILSEHLANRVANLALGPLGHLALGVRNAESLRRLRTLVEHPDARPARTPPDRPPS